MPSLSRNKAKTEPSEPGRVCGGGLAGAGQPAARVVGPLLGAHADFSPKARCLQGKEKVNTSTFHPSLGSSATLAQCVLVQCVLCTYSMCTVYSICWFSATVDPVGCGTYFLATCAPDEPRLKAPLSCPPPAHGQCRSQAATTPLALQETCRP